MKLVVTTTTILLLLTTTTMTGFLPLAHAGTNKTLAPTPGVVRPTTPFPTEFVNTPPPTYVLTTPIPSPGE
eukprot:CCRYP_001577-RA/>CCRYP_001577-RA protein AED:0.09 eAED:0.09 QI:317/1/1/1/1/0.88/9/2286/70